MNERDALNELRRKRLQRMVALCGGRILSTSADSQRRTSSPWRFRTRRISRKIPLTKKEDFMAAPEDFSLDPAWLPELPFEERTMWNVAYTTGTTSGRPSPFSTPRTISTTSCFRRGPATRRKACGPGTSSRISTRSRPCPWAGFSAACAPRKSWVFPW